MYEKLKNSIKQHWILWVLLVFGVLGVFFIVTLKEYILVISEVIQFSLVITAFVLLYIQFYKEKVKEQQKEKSEERENLPILRNRITFIINIIYDKRNILVPIKKIESGTNE